MGEIINSISFQDNNISWILAEVESGQSITIKRVAENPLPFIINYDNIQKPTTALRIANHLYKLASKNDLPMQNVRFLLSGKFGMVKKIQVDRTVPENVYPQLVEQELQAVLPAPVEDYLVYQPAYTRPRELLTFCMRKSLFSFFQRIATEARLPVSQISLNCFSIDELYRRFFPNIIGQTLLVNFTDRGFETVLSDENSFLNFSFKPYAKSLQSIDQLEESEIFSAFTAMVDDVQHPGPIDMPLYSVSQVFLFGTGFKAHWLDRLQNQCSHTLRILNPTDSAEWQIISEDTQFNSMGAYRFVEPLSNVF